MQTDEKTDIASKTGRQTQAILIANPTAGSYQQHVQQIRETVNYLHGQGWQAELKLTEKAGDAGRLAHAAVEQKIDAVIAVGGDGTIHEIIQELAGSETALGVLPGGTVNVWAREVGIPLDEEGARRVLIEGQTRKVDLCQINQRYFLLMAGIGVDAAVTHAVEKKAAKRLGIVGYVLMGAWLGIGYPDFQVVLDLDGKMIRLRALQVIIGNTQLYGGAIKYTWLAKCDDGLLDICIVRKQNIAGRIGVIFDFLFRRRQRRQWIRYETGSTVTIHTRHPEAMQVDGEPMGYTAPGKSGTVISVVPGALKVIVPQQLPKELFSQREN